MKTGGVRNDYTFRQGWGRSGVLAEGCGSSHGFQRLSAERNVRTVLVVMTDGTEDDHKHCGRKRRPEGGSSGEMASWGQTKNVVSLGSSGERALSVRVGEGAGWKARGARQDKKRRAR